MNRVAMRRKFRSHLLVNLLHLGIGVARVQVLEDALGAIEPAARLLEGNDRVVERRLGGIVRDWIDLFELLAHAGLDRRFEILIPDLVEWRELERQRAFFEKRIRS